MPGAAELGILLGILILLTGGLYWIYKQGQVTVLADIATKEADHKDQIADEKLKYADAQHKVDVKATEDKDRVDALTDDELIDDLRMLFPRRVDGRKNPPPTET